MTLPYYESLRVGFYHSCNATPDGYCHCFDSQHWTFTSQEVLTVTDERGPVEDDINDPKLQDQSPDLPAPVEGNDDEDDTEEPADTGAVEPEEE